MSSPTASSSIRSLNHDEYAQVVRMTPLVSIDLLIKDPTDHALVGLRRNAPAKGTYFVPGGVIHKNETLDAAFARILKAETGLQASRKDARFFGLYQHFYAENRFGDPSYNTHYVVLAHELVLDYRPVIQLDSQHSRVQWLTAEEMLKDLDVHENTKAYFR
jgi:colanic acid biosynthesis protein WcaH